MLKRLSQYRYQLVGRWQQLRRDRPGIDHLASAYQHYKKYHGDHLAAAITYFSFLALFPIIFLGVSVAGFVLVADPHLQTELFTRITEQLPGTFGKTLQDAIDVAVKQRTAVGLVGLVGVALTGLGWISNLRTGIDTLWCIPERKRSFVMKKLADALVLLGLGVGVLVSLAITAGGTAASGLVLRQIGADHATGAGTLASVLAILLGIVSSVLIFGWILIRIPDVRVSRRTAFRSSLLAAVGFEILKVVGTFYIARVTKSPAASVIGPALGVLIWINLVSRFLLYCVAWASTARDAVTARDAAVLADSAAEPAAGPPTDQLRSAISPTRTAAGLFSAGVTIGVAAFAVLQSLRNRARGHQPPQP